MKFKFFTAFIIFMIASSLYHIYEFKDDWSSRSFFTGIVCGLPLITCYLANKRIGALLFLLGLFSLILIAVGAFEDIERDRLFFTGLTIGALGGWLPAFFIIKKEVCMILATLCRHEGYQKLAIFFYNQEQRARKD